SKRQLRLNRCVAIPTETVYGLAANALDSSAVSEIYRVKGRPSDNPLIVHGEELAQLMREAQEADRQKGGDGKWPEIPRAYHEVIRRFWPGPLTIVMPRPKCIPMAVLGGHGDTVAFRFPSHPVARAIISACGLPLAAPSANASGRPSPTQAAHVKHDLDGRLPLIVDAGACDVGVESTVLDAYSRNAYVGGELAPCILRPGGVTFEQLQELGGEEWKRLRVYRRDFTSSEMEANPTTPGMKYRHYSPTAPVYLFVPSPNAAGNASVGQKMRESIGKLAAEGAKRLGAVIIGDDGSCQPLLTSDSGECAVVVHRVADARELAHEIFALLRSLDEDAKVDGILVQGVSEDNEGLAVMNRLGKAASQHI
ncbi:translation factor, partial [Martensiomyces pterosporus]